MRGNIIWRFTLGLFCCCAMFAHPQAADSSKVLRTSFEAPDAGFDGALTVNYFSGQLSEAIFERLLSYDYLARPAKVVPGTVEALPEISDGGKTFVFHLRKGIYFTPDPAFKGRRRELVANDYIYTFKRVLDPANHSPIINFLAGKIVGLDALAEKARKTGHFDYDAPVPGLQAPDPYTLRIELNQPDYNFIYMMAFPLGQERYQLYAEMNRQMEADTPWLVQTTRIRNWVSQPWVMGFKKHPILNAGWEYLDVQPH